MPTTGDRPAPHLHALDLPHSRSRRPGDVQILGGTVLGVGPAAAVGPNPGPLFAAHPIGPGLLLLCTGLLLPEDPATDRRGQP